MGGDLVVIFGIVAVVVAVLFGLWLAQRSQYKLKAGRAAEAWQVTSENDLRTVLGEALGIFVEWMVGFRSSPLPGGGYAGQVSWATPRIRGTTGGMIIGAGPEATYTQEFVYLPVDAKWPLLRIIPQLIHDAEIVDTEWGDFNRRFDVRSEDREYAHAVLIGPVQEYLASQAQGLSLALLPGGIAVAAPAGITVGAERMTDVATGFLQRIPGFVWTQYGGAARPHL